MKKSELRKMIKEELLKETQYVDVVAKKIAKAIKPGMSESDKLAIAYTFMKKDIGLKRARSMMVYDEDFAPDLLQAIG